MGLVQCAYLWAPSDQEFLHMCETSVVFDLSWFGTGQDNEDGCVPSRGVATPEGFYGGCGLPFGGGVTLRLFFSSCFGLKWRTMRVPFLSVGWEVGGFPWLPLWWVAEMPCLLRGVRVCLGCCPRQVRRCLANAGRWRDLLPLGLRFLALGGASPRGS